MAEELQENETVAPPSVQADRLAHSSPEAEKNFGPAISGEHAFNFERRRHDEEPDTGWAVPWADFMMVMFVLFAILLAVQMQEGSLAELFATRETEQQPRLGTEAEQAGYPLAPSAERNPGADTKAPPSAEQILRESREAVVNANLDTVDVALTKNQAIRVSVRGPMFFELGKADLKPTAASFLQGLAAVIRRNRFIVQVVGHTDDFPIDTERFPSNWELSAVRATTVARYLIARGGIDAARFTVIGHADHRPAVPNTTLANKALNRRVEIIITRDEVPVPGEDTNERI